MESETFRSRVVSLLQKSRQAFRLYSTMGRMPGHSERVEAGEKQANEWRQVNAELIRELSSVLELPQHREQIARLFALRDRFQQEFRLNETEQHVQQRELLAAVEGSDFVRSAVISQDLISKKARVQALQAAHHELEDLIIKSRLVPPAILLTTESVPEAASPDNLARVIPLRRRV